MKKGLFAFLIISVSCLLCTLALAYILYNYNILSHDNISDSSSAVVATFSPEEAPAASQSSEAPITADASATPAVTANPDEDPLLPEITPEPDMDPDTWDYIKGGDYNMVYKDKEEAPEVMPYKISVNKQMNTVTIYKAGKNGKYSKAVKSMVCSAGRETPLGTFNTSDKYYWKAMIHNVWAQYATRITGKILFHSVPYDTHEKDTLISNYYNQLGSTASAGCVRLAVQDAKWIIENCPAGTPVEIYNSPDAGPLGKPSPVRIPSNCTWDPTDPDTRNPWQSDKSAIIGVKNKTLERGAYFNIYEGIIAFDKSEKNMTTGGLKAKGKLDTSKPGTYTITYSFKPKKGKKISETATYTVTDTKAPVISGLESTIYTNDSSKINEKYLIDKAKITDNGLSLSKKEHLTVKISDKKAVLTAKDDYNHITNYTVTIIEDKKAPDIVLKKDSRAAYPISYKLSKEAARKRVKKVCDNKKKLSAKDLDISVKYKDWGINVSYTVKDDAGNKASVTEHLAYETATLTVVKPDSVVNEITDTDALIGNVKLISDITGKKVDCKIKTKHIELAGNEVYAQYEVTYTATYSSAAGKKTSTATSVVSVPRIAAE